MRVYTQVAHKQVSKKEGRTPVKRICRTCGVEIKLGETYFWFKHRHQGKTYFCKLHRPGQKEMTQSDKLASLYEAQDQISDAIGAVEGMDLEAVSTWQGEDEPEEPEVYDDDDGESQEEHDDWETEHGEWETTREEYQSACSDLESNLNDLVGALRGASETAQEVADGYHESADNMEDGFGHETSTSADVRQKGDDAEEWVSSLDEAADTVEGLINEIEPDSLGSRALNDIQQEACTAAGDARDALNL